MSVSRRIKKRSEKTTDELQAKIVLEKGEKISKIEIIDKAIQFARENEREFIEYVLASGQENDKDLVDPMDWITKPVMGGKPEDYIEYNFEDIEGD